MSESEKTLSVEETQQSRDGGRTWEPAEPLKFGAEVSGLCAPCRMQMEPIFRRLQELMPTIAAESKALIAEKRALEAELAGLRATLEGERLHWQQIHTGCHAERDALEAEVAELRRVARDTADTLRYFGSWTCDQQDTFIPKLIEDLDRAALRDAGMLEDASDG